jgi:hypothetical protein
VPVFDYTYDGVMRSLEQSVLRLGIARIDLLLVHDVDFWTVRDHAVLEERFRTVMDSGYRALDELRRAGVIGAIGCGLNETEMCLRFARAGDFDCMLLAGRYTLLEQAGPLAEFLPYCQERGMSVIIGGPYNSGILAGPRAGGRALRLRGGAARGGGEGAADRGGLRPPWRAPAAGRAAIPAGPPGGLRRDPRRAEPGGGGAEPRPHGPPHPRRALGRAAAGGAAGARARRSGGG